MSKKNSKVSAKIIKAARGNIYKSDRPCNLGNEEKSYTDWLAPSIPLIGLESMVEHSSILPQCISAYKSNIAGFGISVRYKEDKTDTKNLRES